MPIVTTEKDKALPGNFITDFDHYPFTVMLNDELLCKTFTATTYDLSDSAFHTTAIATLGSYTDMVVADTYYDIVDVSGSSGILGNMISQYNYSAANILTVELTIDGVMREIVITGTSRCPVWGPVFPLENDPILIDKANAYPINLHSESFSLGMTLASGRTVRYLGKAHYIMSPQELIEHGFPVFYFNDSLKIRVKKTIISYGHYFSASYMTF